MRKERQLACFLNETESSKCEGDMLVQLAIYDVSASLLEEFARKVVRQHYPSGVSDAIKDLMRKAIEESRQKEENG